MAVQQVVPLRYNDPRALDKELKMLFGDGNYAVDFEMGQFILTAPRQLTENEIAHIKSKQRHYKRRSNRGNEVLKVLDVVTMESWR
ncbi:hypothetical protein N656DRAFT_346862 [Canariomyces notabilis]|uniref:Uncharacterized protein n=1 Tax=Canariomyces notabilis TaxID=2074819 RepID=A0AAN6QFF8_9PEZI|nr:hypothetical protein N656DRAFT_346862 [Canariomyces arenarius]